MTAQIPRKQFGNLISEGVPDIPSQLSEKLQQYQNVREATVIDWLQDGSGLIISTRFGETAQFHIVKSAGGVRRQITFFKEPLAGGRVCPNPQQNSFLFTKDIGGSESYQLFNFDLHTGKYELLTDGHSRHSNGFWNNTGTAFVYSKTNEQDHHLYIQNRIYPKREELIFAATGYWFVIDWSPDDRYLTIGNYISANESHIYILNVLTGETQLIGNNIKRVAYHGGYWSKDGQGIYLTADDDSEFLQLKYYHIKQRKITTITNDIQWNIEQFSMSPKGDIAVFTVNEAGLNRLYLLNTKDHSYHLIQQVPLGQISGLKWHPDNRFLALSIATSQTPSDVFVLDIYNELPERWTFSEVGGLNTDHFIAPQLIHYQTFDKKKGAPREIPAFYYRPNKGEQPYPVLIYIHGGPESQYRPNFSSIIQYYVKELGIAVLAPNVRGSSGYGKTYVGLDDGYKREDSVKDIGTLLNWIKEQNELDTQRISVMGGSYGGYMVLAAMTHYNSRLKCGIDIVGISNFVTFLENTKSYRRDLRRVEYGDERDPKMRQHLMRISPTTNAHKITRPMLIAQGFNDPRVPTSEAEQMLQAIRKNGGEAWYLLAKDEGHGFRKKSNQDYYTKSVIMFLQKYLLQ